MWNLFRHSLIGKRAKDITGERWLNVTSFPEEAKKAAIDRLPLRFDRELLGLVTLIHFWDYSSADSLEDLPFLHEWWERYEGSHLMIIGVHTPQYEFAKDADKVEAAVLRFHLDYPIVNDGEYTTWKRYGSHVWPRKILVDSKGIIRFDHSGQGGHEELELQIQEALEEAQGGHHGIPRGNMLTPPLLFTRDALASQGIPLSPLTDPAEFHIPRKIPLHGIALSGWWILTESELVSGPLSDDQACAVHFFGSSCGARMRSMTFEDAIVRIFINTEQVDEDITISSDAIYPIVPRISAGAHHLTIIPIQGTIAISSLSFS